MSFDMEYYQKINNMYGSKSKKDVQLYHLKNQVNNRFTDTIDCYEVGINDGVMELLIIRTKNDYIKSIKARPFDDFNVGDYVNWESNEWMVTSKDEGNQVYTTGKMQLCNWTLKWQDETGTILSYPCVTSSGSIGEDSGKVITLPSNQKYILLPFNERTSKLKADDRFFVDRKNPPTPYKIIGDTDTTSYMGLIQILVEADVLRDGDNIELGVCDYVKSDTTLPPVKKGNSVISINGELLVGGRERTLTAISYNLDGTINTDIDLVWSIDFNGLNKTDFTYSFVGNMCKVMVVENYDLCDQTIVFKVASENNEYYGELSVNIKAGF